MLKKSHVLMLGVATAGMIGFAAPMASAATVSGPSSLVNVSGNQIPIQVCGNDVYGNVIGAQVPAEGDALVASLLSPGSVTKAKAVNNRGCVVYDVQQNGSRNGGSGLVNAADNQIPVQVCGNDVFINGIGAQVPLYGLAGAITGLSPAAVTKSTAVNNQGCDLANSQQNGQQSAKHHSKHGTCHSKHGTCPCRAGNATKEGAVTSAPAVDPAVRPASGHAVTSNVAGHPVNGGAVTSGLAGLPAGAGALTSGLQGSK
jgi:hypothetical protein